MSTVRLLRWLGPWTNQERAPKNIEKESLWIEDDKRRMEMWVYSHPTRQKGAIFVIPGIHYEGPADERLDRFCRVLADSGMVVGCPFLPTMIDLVMCEALLEDVERAFQGFVNGIAYDQAGIFSISAASVAALHLATVPTLEGRIRAVHLFGGFSRWSEALIFALNGELYNGEKVQVDALGLPVAFLNLIRDLEDIPEDHSKIQRAWMDFIHQTWEKPHMEDPKVHTPIAERLAEGLPASQQSLFLEGCSVRSGGVERAIKAIHNYSQDGHWLDPQPLLKKLHSPLYISHGRDDFVVPYTQAAELAELCPKERLHGIFLTGFYHHTGPVRLWRLLTIIPKLPMELYNSIQMLRAITKTGVD